MIISDEHGFVFVHIPKCAGTTIRKFIKKFNCQKDTFYGIDNHPDLGRLDLAHIPLFTLREHYLSDFEAMQIYWSFAVVRNPYYRFVSSLSERIKNYKVKFIEQCSEKEIRYAILETIEYLTKNEHCLLSHEFIYFQKQVDYIKLDGEQIIESIYTIEQIDELVADFQSKIGKRFAKPFACISSRNSNRSFVFRNNFIRGVYKTLRPKANSLIQLLPKNIKQRIWDWIYVPTHKRLRGIFEEDHVKAFIRDYYSDDIILYQSVLEAQHS